MEEIAMKHPFLIAGTPRAGRLCHRYLVPSADITDAQAAEWIAAAEKQAVGPNLLAATWSVSQQAPDGTARHGCEVLALVGLDIAALDAAQQVNLVAALHRYRPALERLVTDEIEWDANPDHLCVIYPGLIHWL